MEKKGYTVKMMKANIKEINGIPVLFGPVSDIPKEEDNPWSAGIADDFEDD